MTEYTLRFRPDYAGEEEALVFTAQSMADALDYAKERAEGTQAELLVDGKAVCMMRLVEETGVWLVSTINVRDRA